MKKRFISGAICPRCQSQDTLRWWQAQWSDNLECVVCDYRVNKAMSSLTETDKIHVSDMVILQTPIE